MVRPFLVSIRGVWYMSSLLCTIYFHPCPSFPRVPLCGRSHPTLSVTSLRTCLETLIHPTTCFSLSLPSILFVWSTSDYLGESLLWRVLCTSLSPCSNFWDTGQPTLGDQLHPSTPTRDDSPRHIFPWPVPTSLSSLYVTERSDLNKMSYGVRSSRVGPEWTTGLDLTF